MIDSISFLLLILLCVGLSHAIAPRDRRNRLIWTVVPGALLLFVIHPLALAFALASCALSAVIFLIGRASERPRLRARLPYAILLMLFVPDAASLLEHSPVLWLGSAFFIVRQMMTVAQGMKTKITFGQFVPALLMSTYFFAALPSGPVFSGLRTWGALGRESGPSHGAGLYRLFEGFVYLFAVAGFAGMAPSVIHRMEDGLLERSHVILPLLLGSVAEALAAFAFLFATFYGYSRMAEGAALLFGFEVPQNFDKPHLARDLGEFWKRWHRSMADFVMQYIYLPLLVTTSRAKVALIAAFVFMGLWHNLSFGFFVWGVGHGIGLAFILPYMQRHRVAPVVVRVASFAYVVMLSNVAHGI